MQLYNSAGKRFSSNFINIMVTGETQSYDMKIYTVALDTVSGYDDDYNFNDITLIDKEIMRATVNHGNGESYGSDSQDFTIGDIPTGSFSVDFYDLGQDLTDAMIQVHVGVLVGEAYEYAVIGNYKVISQKYNVQSNTTTVEAISWLRWIMDKEPYTYSRRYISPGELRNSLGRLGSTLDYDSSITEEQVYIYVGEDMTFGNVFTAFANYYGCLVFETYGSYLNQKGAPLVKVKAYSNAYFNPTYNHLTKPIERSETPYVVDGITININETQYVYGTGKVQIEYGGGLSQTERDAIWERLENYTFYPGLVTLAFVDLRATVADNFRIIVDGQNQIIPLRGISATYDGGYYGTYSSTGLTDIASDMYEGPMTERITAAQKAAEEAAAAASATSQYFWHNNSGAHVTDEEKDEYLISEDAGFPDWNTDETSASYRPYYSVLLNSLGQLFKTGKYILSAFTHSAVSFFDGTWDGTGTGDNYVTATFGVNGYQIGKTAQSHQLGDYHSLQLIDKNNNTYFYVSDLRDTTGYATMEETFTGDGSTKAFTVNYTVRSKATTSATVDETAVTVSSVTNYISGANVTLASAPANGATVVISYQTGSDLVKAYTLGTRATNSLIGGMSVATGENVIASGWKSFAEGSATTASGTSSHAEGGGSIASAQCAHAEGIMTTASGWYAHAEGFLATASGDASHAEGRSTASKDYAHAEGAFTTASANSSHSQNLGTIAASSSQTAMGKYNVSDTSGTYALIIGNGTSSSARSNALTVDWNGNMVSGNDTAKTPVLLKQYSETGGRDILVLRNDAFNVYSGSTNPSATTGMGVAFRDASNNWIGLVQSYVLTNGNTDMRLRARRYGSSGVVENAFQVGVNASGARYYSVSDKAAFRSAIGATFLSYNTLANWVTASTNFSFSGGTMRANDYMARFNLAIKTTNALTANTEYTVGTLKEGFRPSMAIFGACTTNLNIHVRVNASGVIFITPRQAISAGSTIYIGSTLYDL